MAVYGSFTYGSGVKYGVGLIDDVDVLASDVLRLKLSLVAVVNDLFFDISNYSIVRTSSSGYDARVRKILVPYGTESTLTNEILIHTDKLAEGAVYTITITGLKTTQGTTSGGVGKFQGRRTKIDTALQSIPAHFNKLPDGVLRNLLTAMVLEDERIGGSRKDRLTLLTAS